VVRKISPELQSSLNSYFNANGCRPLHPRKIFIFPIHGLVGSCAPLHPLQPFHLVLYPGPITYFHVPTVQPEGSTSNGGVQLVGTIRTGRFSIYAKRERSDWNISAKPRAILSLTFRWSRGGAQISLKRFCDLSPPSLDFAPLIGPQVFALKNCPRYPRLALVNYPILSACFESNQTREVALNGVVDELLKCVPGVGEPKSCVYLRSFESRDIHDEQAAC